MRLPIAAALLFIVASACGSKSDQQICENCYIIVPIQLSSESAEKFIRNCKNRFTLR